MVDILKVMVLIKQIVVISILMIPAPMYINTNVVNIMFAKELIMFKRKKLCLW